MYKVKSGLLWSLENYLHNMFSNLDICELRDADLSGDATKFHPASSVYFQYCGVRNLWSTHLPCN